MNPSNAPRSLKELRNVILLVREACGILDLESSLRDDPEIQALADKTYDLLCELRTKNETLHTDTGWGWVVEPTIEIKNKVEA